MSTIIVSGSSPSTISVSIPQVNTIVVTPPEVRTISATLNVGTAGTPGQGVEAGGTTGQSLVKINDNDYATTWADRLASVVEDTAPELGGDLNTAGNAITFEDDAEASAGSLSYNNGENTVAYTNADGVSIELGEKNVFYGKAAEAISKGDVVMFGGVQGNHLLLKKADQQASGFIPEWVIGFAAQDLDTNDWGYVVWFGKLDGLSGYDTATYSEGDLLYLDVATPGAVRLSEPTPPNHSILLAAVLKPSNGNAGKIIIRPTHKPDTDEVPEGSTNLYFTDARAQAAVETLKENNITLSDATRSVGLLSGGRLVFVDATTPTANNLLYIDEATRRVGINVTGAPSAALDVVGGVKMSGNLEVGGSTVTLANTATLGVASGERFVIGPLSGSANLTISAGTDFTEPISANDSVRFMDGVNYVEVQAPTLSANHTITLPVDGGTNGYVLSTNGSGVTSWVAQSGGATVINDLSDVDTSTVAPTDGQALLWDNTAQQWEPGTVSTTSENLGNTDLTLSAERDLDLSGNALIVKNGSTETHRFFSNGYFRATGRAIVNGNPTVGGTVRLVEASNNGSNYVDLRAPADVASNVTYTLPGSIGSDDLVLTTDTSGDLTWNKPENATAYHTITCGFFDDIGTSGHFLPLNGPPFEQPSNNNSYSAWLCPAGGQVEKVLMKLPTAVTAGTTLTFRTYSAAVGANPASESVLESVSITIADTDDNHVVEIPFTATSSFSAGELLFVSVAASVDFTSSQQNMYCQVVTLLDWTTRFKGTTPTIHD